MLRLSRAGSALLALALAQAACTSHRSLFDSDGGIDDGNDAGPADGGAPDAGSPDGGMLPGMPVSIRITGLPMGAMQVGATAALHVIASDANNDQADVTAQAQLTSSNTQVATLSGATLTAVASGAAIVRASFSPGGTGQPLTAQAAVLVTDAAGQMIASIAVAPDTVTLAPGLGSQLAANATLVDGTTRSITAQATWTSSDATLCTVGDTAATKGYVTAIAAGTCTVTATMQNQSGSATVTIAQLQATAISIAPASATLAAGATAPLTASVTLSDGSVADATHTATWSSSAGAIATVQNGLVSGVAAGSATITAALDSLNATAAITVTAATLKSISVSPPQSVIAAGLTVQLAATAVYSDNSTADVTAQVAWSSDTTSVAALVTSGVGLVDALTPGRANVSATLSNVTGSALINVTAATPVRLQLAPSPLTLPAGVSQQVTALGFFSDHSVRDVSADATWTLSNSGVATVSSSGLVSGLATGTSTLTATLSGASATDAITVTAAQLAQILLLPQNSAVNVGGTQQLTATGIYGDNSLHDVTAQATWTSSAGAIASVSNAAGSRGLVTGASAGNAQITASVGSITSGPASVTVSSAALSSIRLQPAQILTAVYITVPTRVTARYADGSEVDVTSQCVFGSSNAQVATVVAAGSDAGEVTGAGQGQANLTASFGGQTASAQVTVVAATLQSITVSAGGGRGGGGPGGGNGGAATLEVGQSQQLTATAQFQGAPVPIDVTTLVTWTSSDPTVAKFVAAPNGLLTAQGAGSCTVAAEMDGISGTLAVTVTPVTPVSIAVVQASFTLPAGVTRALVAIGTYADGSTLDLTYGATWSSDANAVAVVGDSGVLKGLVTGVAAGSAHITAALDGVSGQASVTVNDATATALSVTPVNPVVTSNGGGGGGGGFRPTDNYPFYATASFNDGSSQDVTQSCVWTSSDPSVLTISDQAGTKGVADIIAAGGATVTATFRALSGSTFLTSR